MAFIYLAHWKDATIYIGQTTKDLVHLAKRYGSYTKSKRKTNRLSEMACRLHGLPTFRILETCSPTELDAREQYWIGVYSCYPKNLNSQSGGYCRQAVQTRSENLIASKLARMESKLVKALKRGAH